MDGNYFLCDLEKLRKYADIIEAFPIPLNDRFLFIQAPIGRNNDDLFKNFAEFHSKGNECSIADFIHLPTFVPREVDELKELENIHKSIILYQWLAMRFPKTFVDAIEAENLKTKCEKMINTSLSQLELSRRRKNSHRRWELLSTEDDEDLKPLVFESPIKDKSGK